MKVLFSVYVIASILSAHILVKNMKNRAKIREESLIKMSVLREDELTAKYLMREEQLKEIVTHSLSAVKGLLNVEMFFCDLILFMNDYYFGVVDWLKANYPELNDADVVLICLLFFKFSPQELCTLYGLEQVGAIYTRCSRVAKKIKISKEKSIALFLEEKIVALKAQNCA